MNVLSEKDNAIVCFRWIKSVLRWMKLIYLNRII